MPGRRTQRRQKMRAASQVKPVNADHTGAPARRLRAAPASRTRRFRDVVARRDEQLARRIGAVLRRPRDLADDAPMLVERARQRGRAEELRATRPGVVRAESRRRRIEVGVPGAEVGAVDRVQRPVGLAAADAQAVTRARQRRPAFEAERALVVDGEAALEDDRRVAVAGGARAGFVAPLHPGVGADADAPVGREGELERDRDALAADAGAGVLVQVTRLDLEPAGRRQGRRRRHARAVRNGGRGIVRRLGGDGRGRRRQHDRACAIRVATRRAAVAPASPRDRARCRSSAPNREDHRHRSAPSVEANDLNRCRDGASSRRGRARSSPRPAARARSGRKSAIQTKRVAPLGSANTCALALWWLSRPPTTDQATRRRSASTSTISSRATMPLAKVTTRAPGSSRQSVTKPGTRRVCSAPTSASASQTSAGGRSMTISRWTDAIAFLPSLSKVPA